MAIDHNFGNMDEFLSAAHKRRYPRGSKIIYADEESDSIYYLTQVSVTVLIEDDNGRKIIVAYLSEGDFFGEIGLFGEGKRTAWIKAKTECKVAELGYAKFVDLHKRGTGMLFQLTSQVVERLGNATKKVSDLAFSTLLDGWRAHCSISATSPTP